MLRAEAVATVRPSYQLIQVEDMFLIHILLHRSLEKDMMSQRQTYNMAGKG